MRIRMTPTAGTALLLLVAVLCTTAPFVAAHGSLSQPKSRNVLRPIRGETWWREHGNGVGEATTGPKPVNGPGVCGDPFQHYNDASYYSNMSSQPIQATYTAGQAISVTWDITVNHGGRIGLKVCARRSNLNAACFNNYPLYRADIPSEKYTYIMAGGTGPMTARYLLPAGLTCTNGCMLQWEYLTMNSCFEACNRAVCAGYADKTNPVTGASNMADCCLGSTCPAATTVPEVFRNCADIKILASGPMVSPSPIASPSPAPRGASPSPKPQQASPSPKLPALPVASPSPAPAIVDNCPSQPGAARAACFCQGVTVYKYYADTANACSGAMRCYAPGQSTYTTCPAGTLFSDARQYCDWPANVQCSATPPPPPAASPSPAPSTASPSPAPPKASPSPLPPTASPSPRPPSAGGSVGDYIPAALFEQIFLHRNDVACSAKGFYTYSAFLEAAAAFPGFGTSGDAATNKREIAAFLGQISHETTGGWPTAPDGPYSWGLCWITEGGWTPPTAPYCAASAEYPCAAGKTYYGRGPMQLSWNYNYIPAGEVLGFDGLNNPDAVAQDPVLAFKTAIWFWMTPRDPKPSCHDVMTGRWVPTPTDIAANRLPGYGMTTNIINGGLECGIANDSRVNDRIGYYKRYADILGVTYGSNLDCATMRSY